MKRPSAGIAIAALSLALIPLAAACGGTGSGPTPTQPSTATEATTAAGAGATSGARGTPSSPPTSSRLAGAAARAPGDAQAKETGMVDKVVDGDTVDVRGVGRIRVIGIDTPERGECGFGPATSYMKTLVLGRTVALVSPDGSDDEDKYGRKLRYVDVDGTDAGLAEIMAGLARARYDSRDGYAAHPREQVYIAADEAAPSTC